MDTDNKEPGNKRGPAVNLPILFGLAGGAVLGAVIGYIAGDMPLYTGFGMIAGMAIAFDIGRHVRKSERDGDENGGES